MHHVLSAHQFEADELGEVFERSDSMRESWLTDKRALAQTHIGETVVPLFYEASTRTRLSFVSAAVKLGMGVASTENAKEFSSAIKGETLEDTIRNVHSFGDIVILRHDETGAADRAAAVSKVPIINAGDGKGQHPTQALLDLYTIQNELHRTEGLKIVIGGDLKQGRTARSLAQLLSLYEGNHIEFVSTPKLQIGQDIKDHLQETGTTHNETDDMHAAVRDADVVYWTRLQKERHKSKKGKKGPQSHFIIDQSVLDVMPEYAIIMHPLPRNHEISSSVDSDPRAKYFQQAANGLYVRMALLDMIVTSRETTA